MCEILTEIELDRMIPRYLPTNFLTDRFDNVHTALEILELKSKPINPKLKKSFEDFDTFGPNEEEFWTMENEE